MITTTYNYTSGSGFTYDATKITFISSVAQLLLNNNPGQNFSQSYSSGSDFTYNSSYTEFTGGNMNQINQAPANLLAYAAWNSFLNVNYGTDSLAVTAFNSAAVAAGVLNLTGSSNKYVELPTSYVVGNQATIAFVYTPNYSGTPGANQIMYGNSGSNNYFALLHAQSTGHLNLTVSNSTGTAIINAYSFGTWNPTSGTAYTIVLQLDLINGATKAFINGSQFGSTNNTTGTRTASVAAWVGSDGVLADGNANYSIKSFALYSAVVSPAGITPLPDTNFTADTITLPTFSYSNIGNIQSWTSATITDSNAPGYILNNLYWNGSAWVTSNGTYAQSSSAVMVQLNIAALPAANSLVVEVITQTSASIQMSCSLFSINYMGQIYPTNGPTISPNAPLTMDQLSIFADVNSQSDSTLLLWYLVIGSTKYWWSGSTWAVSNGTHSQANSSATIQSNASTLPISLGAFVTPYALLYSPDGQNSPTLTSLTLTYDYFGERPVGPNVCTVYGYIVDESDAPVVGAIVTIQNPTTFINQGIVVAQGQYNATTDSIGYFHINLVETATLTPTIAFNFSVVYPYGTSMNIGTPPNTFAFGNAQIPNAPEANITSLSFT